MGGTSYLVQWTQQKAPWTRFLAGWRLSPRLAVATIAMLTMACSSTPKAQVAKVRLAGSGKVLADVRTCLQEPCVAPPDSHAPPPPPPAPSSGWSLLASLFGDDPPSGKPCKPAKLPAVVDAKCNSIPIEAYAIWRTSDDVTHAEIQVARTTGIPSEYKYFAGEGVKLEEAERLSTDELIDIYKWSRGLNVNISQETQEKARDIFFDSGSPPGKSRPRAKPLCHTASPGAVYELLRTRPDFDKLKSRKLFEDEHPFDGEKVRARTDNVIVYSKNPTNYRGDIPLCVGNAYCTGSSTSRSVEERIGQIADEVTRVFAPFMERPWGTGHLLHVHVGDYASSGAAFPDAKYRDDIWIDSNTGLAKSPRHTKDWGVVPHEMFHLVQYSYQDSREGDLRPALIEGGAVWAEDLVHSDFNHYASEGSQFFGANFAPSLKVTAKSENKIGDATEQTTDASYGASLFWKYTTERQHANNPLHFGRRLLEAMKTKGNTVSAASMAIDRFAETWMSFLFTNIAHGMSIEPDRYLEESEVVMWPGGNGTRIEQMRVSPAIVDIAEESTTIDGSGQAWSGQYCLLRFKDLPVEASLSLNWNLSNTLAPLARVVKAELKRNELDPKKIEITRFLGRPQDITAAPIRVEAQTALLVIVGERDTGGPYNLNVKIIR